MNYCNFTQPLDRWRFLLDHPLVFDSYRTRMAALLLTQWGEFLTQNIYIIKVLLFLAQNSPIKSSLLCVAGRFVENPCGYRVIRKRIKGSQSDVPLMQQSTWICWSSSCKLWICKGCFWMGAQILWDKNSTILQGEGGYKFCSFMEELSKEKNNRQHHIVLSIMEHMEGKEWLSFQGFENFVHKSSR